MLECTSTLTLLSKVPCAVLAGAEGSGGRQSRVTSEEQGGVYEGEVWVFLRSIRETTRCLKRRKDQPGHAPMLQNQSQGKRAQILQPDPQAEEERC